MHRKRFSCCPECHFLEQPRNSSHPNCAELQKGSAVVKNNAFIRLISPGNPAFAMVTIVVAVLFAFQDPIAFAQPPGPPVSPDMQAAGPANLAPGELDSMVAPIALYPDPILTQVLVASTYPQQVLDASAWVNANSNLQGQALINAAANQPWDASIQALVAFPQVLTMLAQNINWTGQLGDAFLSQQAGVFDAVQRLRRQAQLDGTLKSTPQLTVTTTTQGGQTYIEIQPANPQVVYVPQYQPEAIWGPPEDYPYPQVVYPSTGALATAGLLSFGSGILVGSLFPYGGWGWYPGWGHHTVIVNRNFIDRHHFNRATVGRGGEWIHNPAYRPGGRGEAGRFAPGTPVGPGRPGMPITPIRPGTPGGPGAVRPGLPGAPAVPGRGSAERVTPRPGQAPTPGARPGAIPGVPPMPGFQRAPVPGVPAVPGRGSAERVAPKPGQAPAPGARPGAIPGVPPMPGFQRPPRTMPAPSVGPGRGSAQRMGPMPQAAPRMTPGPRSMPRMGPGPAPGGHMGGRPGGHRGR